VRNDLVFKRLITDLSDPYLSPLNRGKHRESICLARGGIHLSSLG